VWLLLLLPLILLPSAVIKALDQTVRILPGTSDIRSQINIGAMGGGSSFSPESQCVNKTGTVKWINADNIPHTIVIIDGSKGSRTLPTIAPGETINAPFPYNGTYTFYDKNFAYTTGKIIVQASCRK